MKFTRRDLLVWSAGAAAGLIVTPVPWKLLDDTSIWSQNWPWIPQPARVPIETKQSFCTLCPNGCGLRVRMAAGWAVGVAGLNTHPVSHGALCPLAFGAHQLNWHPQRLKVVRHHGSPSSWGEARSAFAKASSEGPVVIIDGYPGRAASSVLETFAEQRKGSYRVVAEAESRALLPYETWTGISAASLGYDLENSRTIVSFGTPLLDGWGMPGRFTWLWAEKAAGATDPQLRLIQIEPVFSRTAARAWQWVPIREGSESALASGLARVLIEQNLVPARGPIPTMTLSEAAAETGLTAEAIQNLARTIAAQSPALVIAGDRNPAVAALNVLLGTVGARGGIVRRSRTPHASITTEDAIADARAVLIDSSVPWDAAPKTDAEVFRFAAWDGGATKADWLLPAPGFLEELTDVPTAMTSAVDTYAVAPSLVKPLADVMGAAQFLTTIDSGLTSPEKVIQARCVDIFHKRSGSLYGAGITPVPSVASVEKLKDELWKGAVWLGEPSPPGGIRCDLRTWPSETPVTHSETWTETWSTPVLPTLATKLYLESNLRDAPERRTA